jgi:catechol 2,3-dioxygenase-like lactoylglutathione lyase family enzyme
MATGDPPAFAQLNLVVADMDASVAFYRRLGLTVDTSGPFAAHHVHVTVPNRFEIHLDSVAFAKRWDAGWHGGQGGGRVVIGFDVPSRDAVDERWADLTAAGYVGQQPPYDAFFGARYAVVEDPDGNPIGLMSPVDPARQGMPPAM